MKKKEKSVKFNKSTVIRSYMLIICFAMRASYIGKSYQQILALLLILTNKIWKSIYLIILIIVFVVSISFLPHPFSAD